MIYRMLGTTGLRVSVVGLGTWQLGGEWGHDYTQDEADGILEAAAEQGINLVDTAECYGDHRAEGLIGDYLARHDRSRWIVATKFGHRFNRFMDRTDDFSPEAMRRQLEGSLRALQVETIDLYQFHSGEDAAFANDDLWSALATEKAAGKIRCLGVSILGKGSERQAREAAERGAEVLQVIYNRLDRRPEELYLPHAMRSQLGVLGRVPLASGLLSGKYNLSSEFAVNDVRSTFDRERMRGQMAEVERIQREEVPPGVPMSQWALAWCLKNPAITAIIPGCRDASQVQANASAVQLLQ